MTREEVETAYGKCVAHQQSVVRIIGPASEKDFVMIEEPGSPWGPRPVHWSSFCDDARVVPDDFAYSPITVKDGTVVPFCGCCLSNAGDEKVDVTVNADVNRWEVDKMVKHLEGFMTKHGIPLRVKANSHGGNLRLSFIANGSHRRQATPAE